jgi:hypothetical protein
MPDASTHINDGTLLRARVSVRFRRSGAAADCSWPCRVGRKFAVVARAMAVESFVP